MSKGLAIIEQFKFQLTAARRRLLDGLLVAGECGQVSTHSRPKAAAIFAR